MNAIKSLVIFLASIFFVFLISAFFDIDPVATVAGAALFLSIDLLVSRKDKNNA